MPDGNQQQLSWGAQQGQKRRTLQEEEANSCDEVPFLQDRNKDIDYFIVVYQMSILFYIHLKRGFLYIEGVFICLAQI